MADYAAELKKILSARECYRKRAGKGDHDIWYSPKSGKSFPVDSKIKSRHTANEVLKQAGFDKEF